MHKLESSYHTKLIDFMTKPFTIQKRAKILLLLLFMAATGFSQTLINPGNHASNYNGYTRGYYFTSPIDMVITKIDIPTSNNSTGRQTAEILRFSGTTPASGQGTQLGYWNSIGATSSITTKIKISKGDVIGVLGHRYTATTNFGAQNSYGAVTNTTIDGNTVRLYRFGYQGNIAAGASNGANLITATTGSIGRVNIYWQAPTEGMNNAAVSAIDSPSTFCAGIKDVWATIQNDGKNAIDSVRVNWSVGGTAQKTLLYKTKLDTVKGKGSYNATVKLGSYNFTAAANVKVWTSFPNGVKDTINGNDTLRDSKGPSLNGTFSVGGTTADYKDLEEAAADLAKFGVCGPVTFNVAAGSYTNRVVLGEISGTSATNTITFAGAGNSGATKSTITHNAGAATRATVLLNGADWVTFKDFEILGTNGTYGYGVHFTNKADHNTIEDCVIRVSTTSTSGNFVGILGSSSLTGTGYGNNGNWNTIKGNQVSGGYYGMRFDGSGTTTPIVGNKFIDNDFDRAYYYGVYAYYQDSVDFIGNTIQNVRRTTFGDGLYTLYWSNARIISNIIDAPDMVCTWRT